MHYTLGPVLWVIVIVIINVKAALIKKVSVDIGKNVTIKCPLSSSTGVSWEREGRNQKMTLLGNGSLLLQAADRGDSGIYTCIGDNGQGIVNLTVRTPPPPLIVSINPKTILVYLLWKVNGTGGYPISYFTAQYRRAFTNDSWIPIPPNNIMPNCRVLEVDNLKPNITYEFRMWATNQLGRSPVTTVLATTIGQYTEKELARHLLKGADKYIRVWWAAAVGIVLGALVLLGTGTCILLFYECRMPRTVEEEPEIIELVPNIILNPGFEGPSHFSDISPDENSNSETPLRLNNNTVVHRQNL